MLHRQRSPGLPFGPAPATPAVLNSAADAVEAFILHAQDGHGMLTTREREDVLTPSREDARTRRNAKIERGMIPRFASFQNQRSAFQPNSSLRPSAFAPLR